MSVNAGESTVPIATAVPSAPARYTRYPVAPSTAAQPSVTDDAVAPAATDAVSPVGVATGCRIWMEFRRVEEPLSTIGSCPPVTCTPSSTRSSITPASARRAGTSMPPTVAPVLLLAIASPVRRITV